MSDVLKNRSFLRSSKHRRTWYICWNLEDWIFGLLFFLCVLGPLVSMALIYEALGFVVAWITKQVCWVPHRFRYGILCAGAFSNYSDIRECYDITWM